MQPRSGSASNAAQPADRDEDAARRGLDRRQVIDAALDLAQTDGLSGVTMRAVAQRLGVSPMAIYHWVHDKTELLELVQDEYRRSIPIPGPETGPWHARLRTYYTAHAARAVRTHGVVAPRPERIETSGATQLVQEQIELLAEAGFSRDRALLAIDCLNSFMFGRVAILDAIRSGRRTKPAPPDQAEGRGPRTAEYFMFGIDLIIDGLRADLAAQQGQVDPVRRDPS